MLYGSEGWKCLLLGWQLQRGGWHDMQEEEGMKLEV